jgi:hypothetical protein
MPAPLTPVTPPPAVSEVFSRPATSTSQTNRPSRYHTIRNVPKLTLPGPSSDRIIHRSASESSLRHPRPIRRIPSASSLTSAATMQQYHALNQRRVLHQRSASAGNPYPQYPSAAFVAASYRLPPAQQLEYNMQLFRNSAKAFQAPSAWSAIHPPTHHFRHAASTSSLREMAQSNGSTASFATFRQLPVVQNPYLAHLHHRRARTAGSASSYSSRSGHVYQQPLYAQSWNGGVAHPPRTMTFSASRASTPLHRKTSSHSSSSGGSARGKGSLTSEVLEEVDEEAITPATELSSSSASRSRSPPRAGRAGSSQQRSHSAPRSASASRSPPTSRSASASRVRDRSTSRSPPQSRSSTPANERIIESYMNRSGTSLASAPGGSARIGQDGKVRKVGTADRRQQSGGSKMEKGKGREIIVQM